jgi:glycosyltransferase involved in cell wall biosynthesis
MGIRKLLFLGLTGGVTKMPTRLASVIISTYAESRLHYAVQAIASVHKQTYREHEVQLIIDDEGGLARAARSQVAAPTRVIVNPHPGMAQARNCGLQHARGDVVVFLDDDAVAEPDWLERLMAHYADDRVVGVGGRSVPAWEGPAAEWFPPELYWVLGCTYRGHPDRAGEVRNIIGNSMSYRTAVVQALGGFTLGRGRYWQITSGTAEETELCLRLRQRFPETRILYEPSAVVHHVVSSPRLRLGYVWQRAVGEGVAKARIHHLHGAKSSVLGHEHRYLRFLLREAIPQALTREGPRRPKVAIARAGMILFVVVATGLGYGWIRVKEYRQGAPAPVPHGALEESTATSVGVGQSDDEVWPA